MVDFYNDTTTCHSYDIFKRVDQSGVYSKVLNKLEKGGCIGIFPEGGSHDRTDLLPLKVGVALIAYTALDKRGLNIPIVPVGLNYFNMRQFRGRAVVEYGEPIYLDPKTLGDYLAGGDAKKSACNGLLKQIEDGMRSVIVTAPDYNTLKHVHTARRLWKRNLMSAEEKQDLNRRFSLGLQQLLAKFQGNLPEELSSFLERIKTYQKEVRRSEDRSDELTTLALGVEATYACTSVQDAPPP
jgi:glycerol-3-phosphate O-acyltransferase/dihydroxyacetone phosphate acyltransferase